MNRFERIKLDNKILADFNLAQTFDCGQCFRWNKDKDGNFIGVVRNNVYVMHQEEDGEIRSLEISGVAGLAGGLEMSGETASAGGLEISGLEPGIPESLKNYFDLDTDYGAIKSLLSQKDPVLAGAIKKGSGIRILRQDLWEALISFIVSQNNNIPRIKGCIEKLCELFGKKICELQTQDGCRAYYSFPEPEALAGLSVADLAAVRLGYRAPYIIETARLVHAEKAVRQELITYPGVGPKVAACVDLFGRHNIDAFPVDVWVKRVMNSYYGILEADVKAMNAYASQHFSPYGGIAQQYLFYAIRE